MLVLPSRAVGDLVVFDDDASDMMYVATQHPRLDLSAGSLLHLIHWVTPQATGAPRSTGAVLNIDLTVAPDSPQMQAAGLDLELVRPLPITGSTIEIDLPQLPPISLTASDAASALALVTAEVSPQQAAVLAPLLAGETASPLQVRWTGTVTGRLPALEVTATVDATELTRRMEEIDGDAIRVTTRSILSMIARVEIVGSSNPELEEVMRDWALTELTTQALGGGQLSIHASSAEVVSWPVAFNGTIDLGAIDRSQVVKQIVLSDEEIGQPLPTQVRVLGDFTGDLERVDVEFTVDGAARPSIALADNAVHAVALDGASFEWRYRIRIAGTTSDWSSWQTSHASAVAIPVGASGPIDIEVAASAMDFDTRWQSVTVSLADHFNRKIGSVLLDGANPSQILGVERSQLASLEATVTYLSRTGYVEVETLNRVSPPTLLIVDPFTDRLLRTIIPSGGGWKDVAIAMIDLRHVGADGRVIDETVELRSLDELATWRPSVDDGDTQTVWWRFNVSFNDGGFIQSEWASTTDPVLVVRLAGQPSRTVHLLPVQFDPALVEKIEVLLTSGTATHTTEFTDLTPQAVNLPPGSYRLTVTWTMVGGDLRQLSEEGVDRDTVVIARPPRDA